MRTSELTGAPLDYWVARAEGLDNETHTPRIEEGTVVLRSVDYDGNSMGHEVFTPSTDWAVGGPIIERTGVILSPQAYDVGPATCEGWIAAIVVYGLENTKGWREARKSFAKTPLIAAMRAYVASVYGDEVPDEIGGA